MISQSIGYFRISNKPVLILLILPNSKRFYWNLYWMNISRTSKSTVIIIFQCKKVQDSIRALSWKELQLILLIYPSLKIVEIHRDRLLRNQQHQIMIMDKQPMPRRTLKLNFLKPLIHLICQMNHLKLLMIKKKLTGL